jgi:hypothetical protein
MIDLFKNRIGKFLHRFPIVPGRGSASRLIPIASFEPTEIVRVRCFLQPAIRPEEDALLVIDKELA